MNRIKNTVHYCKDNNLFLIDDLLQEISVLPVDDMVDDFKGGTENDQKMYQLNTLLSGWFAVANEEGIIAYFGTQDEAFSYRLNYINRVLNG